MYTITAIKGDALLDLQLIIKELRVNSYYFTKWSITHGIIQFTQNSNINFKRPTAIL